jgi:hypothetical protein
MSDVSGVTVVTNACVYYHYTRGCGRAERPAFPASLLGSHCALCSRRVNFPAKSGRMAPRDRGFVSMLHRARCPDQRFAFVRRKPVFRTVSSAGPAFCRLMRGVCTKSVQQVTLSQMARPPNGRVPPSGALKIGHQANSGFRLSPGAYTLPYSPKTAIATAKPPQ